MKGLIYFLILIFPLISALNTEEINLPHMSIYGEVQSWKDSINVNEELQTYFQSDPDSFSYEHIFSDRILVEPNTVGNKYKLALLAEGDTSANYKADLLLNSDKSYFTLNKIGFNTSEIKKGWDYKDLTLFTKSEFGKFSLSLNADFFDYSAPFENSQFRLTNFSAGLTLSPFNPGKDFELDLAEMELYFGSVEVNDDDSSIIGGAIQAEFLFRDRYLLMLRPQYKTDTFSGDLKIGIDNFIGFNEIAAVLLTNGDKTFPSLYFSKMFHLSPKNRIYLANEPETGRKSEINYFRENLYQDADFNKYQEITPLNATISFTNHYLFDKALFYNAEFSENKTVYMHQPDSLFSQGKTNVFTHTIGTENSINFRKLVLSLSAQYHFYKLDHADTLPYSPEFEAKLLTELPLGDFNLFAGCSILTGRVDSSKENMKDFLSLDAGVEYNSFRALKLFAGVYNITDNENKTFDGIPEKGISLKAGLRWYLW